MLDKKLSQNETCCQGWTEDWITQSDTKWCTYVPTATKQKILSPAFYFYQISVAEASLANSSLSFLEWKSSFARLTSLLPYIRVWILPSALLQGLQAVKSISLYFQKLPVKVGHDSPKCWGREVRNLPGPCHSRTWSQGAAAYTHSFTHTQESLCGCWFSQLVYERE